VLATLKEREAKILRLYFGLEGQEPMTLEEIGSLLGITRERVRQIKEKALARLRHVSRARSAGKLPVLGLGRVHYRPMAALASFDVSTVPTSKRSTTR